MDFKRLRYFCVIVDQGQISKAAKYLNIAQPALSQRLKELETELGVTLIARDGRSWRVTEAGQLLYERATQLAAFVDQIPEEIKNVVDGYERLLLIGVVSYHAQILCHVIPTISERYPQLRFRLYSGDTNYIEELLDNNKIDFAITLMPDVDRSNNLIIRALPTSPFVVVYDKNALKIDLPPVVTCQDLDGIPLILPRRRFGGGMHEKLTQAFLRNGLKPNIFLEAPEIDTLNELMLAGLSAAAFLPETEVKKKEFERFQICQFSEDIVIEPVLIWRQDRLLGKAAEAVIAEIVDRL